MNLIPLITSVPPSVVRTDKAGRDIGAAYQEACIRSWIAAGFRPISVNGPGEVVPFADLIEVVRVDRTAKALHGRPVVFISDMCAAARTATAGPVMIINADILLRPSFDLVGVVAGLRADQAIVGRRIDVADPGEVEGEVFDGYDVFAAHGTVFAKIPDHSFAVGLNWWDQMLPLEIYAQGLDIHILTEPYMYHLLHGKKWDDEEWIKLGLVYAKRLAALNPQLEALADQLTIAKSVMMQGQRADRFGFAIEATRKFSPALSSQIERIARSRMRKALRNLAHNSNRSVNLAFQSNLARLALKPSSA
jgi:hypothetical protein